MLDDANVPDSEVLHPADNSPLSRALPCIKSAMQSNRTPIHRLPNELLSEVFLWRLQSLKNDRETENPMIALDRTIACVCKIWRAVAHGEPRLWTHVIAPDPPLLDAYVQRYLPRSGGLPLDLKSRISPADMTAFLRALTPYASRWRNLDLRGTCSIFNNLSPVAAPILTGALFVLDHDGEDNQHLSLRLLNDAPRLHSLTMDHHCHYEGPPFSFSTPPLPSLTSIGLFLWYYDLSILFESLQVYRATLTDLYITVQYPHSDAIAPDMPIELPSLTRLGLFCGSAGLLKVISAPMIEHIILQDIPADTPDALLEFLTRSPSVAAKLRGLVFMMPDDHATLLKCLALTPNLEEIRFGTCPGPLLRGLTIHDRDKPAILPNLDGAFFDGTVEDVEALRDFMDSRIGGLTVGISETVARKLQKLPHRFHFPELEDYAEESDAPN
ncbi:hypothetical protein FB107DRAFT_275424 [Schizophyllum commune]